MNFRDDSLTFIVLARNHQSFIHECLLSLDCSLRASSEIVFIDLGSTDSTVDFARSFFSQFDRKFRVIELKGERLTSTFGLQQILPSVDTEWVGIISGDDVITGNYLAVLEKAISKRARNAVFNFVLQMTDTNLIPLRQAKPRWTRSRFLNTLWMCFENPGKSPGSVLPVQQVRVSKFMNIDPRCLIEDYPLWLCLNKSVRFKKIGNGEVLYRQHAQSLSRSDVSSEYAWSIGYCIGLAKGSADNWLKGILGSAGKKRWLKQINPSLHHVVLDGVECGLKFDWSVNDENS